MTTNLVEPGTGAQGATYDRAHVLANGGGRELAYVALSRARTGTTLHAIADDLPELRRDLALDWHADRAQGWVSDDSALSHDDGSVEERHLDDDVSDQRQLTIRSLDAIQRRPVRSVDDDFGLGL